MFRGVPGVCTAPKRAGSAGMKSPLLYILEVLFCSGLLLAFYRLLSGSIICPQAEPEGQFSEAGGDGRIWRWIQYAGLRLTASELIRLEEQGTDPTPNLLGEEGRQLLTEKLYSARTIREGALEQEIEHSPARDGLVAVLLRLLHAGCLFLV